MQHPIIPSADSRQMLLIKCLRPQDAAVHGSALRTEVAKANSDTTVLPAPLKQLSTTAMPPVLCSFCTSPEDLHSESPFVPDTLQDVARNPVPAVIYCCNPREGATGKKPRFIHPAATGFGFRCFQCWQRFLRRKLQTPGSVIGAYSVQAFTSRDRGDSDLLGS